MFRKLIDHVVYSLFGGVKLARMKGVTVGEGCRLLIKNWGSEPYLINIGDNVTVSSNVSFFNHDGSGWLFKKGNGRYYKYERIFIGNNVFIGASTILLPGVVIGDNVIVGAGSVVSKSLESNCVYAGNPVRKIRDFNSFKEKVETTYIHSDFMLNTKIDKDRVLHACSLKSKNESP
jgi:acetyltransferase-like isoleucine patch superfamily enzyme